MRGDERGRSRASPARRWRASPSAARPAERRRRAAELRLRDRQRQPRRRRRPRWPSGSATSTSSSSTARRRRAGEVAALQARRARRCSRYLSVGTIEKWRSWYAAAQALPARAPGRTGRTSGSPTSRRRACGASSRSGSPPEILAKGFDGLFLDNVDMVEVKRHREQRDGHAASWSPTSASSSHADGGCCSPRTARSGCSTAIRPGVDPDRPPRRLEPRGRHLDLRLRPPPLRAEPDRRPRRGARRARGDRRARAWSTTATDYVDIADGVAAPSARRSPNACGVGALPYVGDIGLTARRLPDRR